MGEIIVIQLNGWVADVILLVCKVCGFLFFSLDFTYARQFDSARKLNKVRVKPKFAFVP